MGRTAAARLFLVLVAFSVSETARIVEPAPDSLLEYVHDVPLWVSLYLYQTLCFYSSCVDPLLDAILPRVRGTLLLYDAIRSARNIRYPNPGQLLRLPPRMEHSR